MKRIMTARNILGYNMYHSKFIPRSRALVKLGRKLKRKKRKLDEK